MRHGNPPNFDADPLMTEKEIANFLQSKSELTVSNHLSKYYAENGIDRPKKKKIT